ncbi:MAG TPA: alpha/beta hydrolase [Steroidobacteraceae bacterium]|nr:alpha/beta hydrolase [Steroidobacteraceae bacterium]
MKAPRNRKYVAVPVLASLVTVVLAAGFACAAAAPPTLQVGGMRLERCSAVPAYCGRLDRPLDPTGALADRIGIYFEYYPHTAPGQASGTLVATEGGPGYPATESREDYLALLAPLRSSRDLLLMDNRGTGKSGVIDCPALQSAAKWTIELIAGCGESLGDRAALYSTAYAADDLAAILSALDVGPIDLYGDSYGTYFEQVFALRHPRALRSIVLDGAYPLDGTDYAWYPSYAPTMRAKFNLACERSPACARLPGSSIDRIVPVVAELRARPFTAHAMDSDGREIRLTANAAQLAIVMFAGSPALATVRELDAAGRAFEDGDRAPLLRLMAETASGVDSRDPTGSSASWSAGLEAVVMCQDAPQIFDMRLAPTQRALDRDRAVTERLRAFPDAYAPFTMDEYRAMPLDYAFLDQCVAWPVSPPGHPASHPVPADAPYPDVPALVISGELDSITTPADGAAVTHAFKHGRQLLVANSFHVNALPRARSPCAAGIVRHFIDTLEPGDTSCASQVPPVRLVARFARHARELEPATALEGNSATEPQLQFVSAAVLTAADVLTRVRSNSTGRGPGLRGGGFRITERRAFTSIALDRVHFTEDLEVSGTIIRSRAFPSRVEAELALSEGATGRLRIDWHDGGPEARAHIRGTIAGSVVVALLPAP